MTFRWTEGCLRNNRSNNIICIIVTTKLLLVSTRLASSQTRYIDPRAINSILPSSPPPYQKLRKKLIPPFWGIIDLRSISIRRSIIRIHLTINSNINSAQSREIIPDVCAHPPSRPRRWKARKSFALPAPLILTTTCYPEGANTGTSPSPRHREVDSFP